MVAGQDWTVSQTAVITEQAKANQHPQTKPKTTNQPTFHRSSAGCNAHFPPFSLFQQRPNNYFSASDDVCSRCFDCFVLPIHWFLTFRANIRLLLLPRSRWATWDSGVVREEDRVGLFNLCTHLIQVRTQIHFNVQKRYVNVKKNGSNKCSETFANYQHL